MFLFGFIQNARYYGSGLNFERLSSQRALSDDSFVEFLLKEATFDTNVFNTSAGIIYKIPGEIDYPGLKPIINTITLPIPRFLWQSKPKGEYAKNVYKLIYDGYLWEVGSAHLGFAEYYLAGGWIALIAINFFIVDNAPFYIHKIGSLIKFLPPIWLTWFLWIKRGGLKRLK